MAVVECFRRLACAIERETGAHAAGLLSERDVHQLPGWTRVEVIWSGGNGPHPYDVVQIHGRPYAVLVRENPWRDPDTDSDIAAGRVPRGIGDPIELVGADHATTWVRLPTSDPWPRRPRSDAR